MVVRPSALQRGGDKNAPAATFGAYLCAVRTMLRIVRIQHCKRLKGVRQGGISPLTLFCFLLQEQKEGPGGEPYRPSPPVTPRRRQATTNFPQKFFCRLLSKEKPPTPAGGEESEIPCMAQATQGIFKGEVMKKAKLRREGCGRWQILRRWRG